MSVFLSAEREAAILAFLTDYRAGKDVHNRPHLEHVSGDGRKIHLSEDRGRLIVNGSWPRRNPAEVGSSLMYPSMVNRESPGITISSNATPERIAAEIKRRFLPDYNNIFAALISFRGTELAQHARNDAEWREVLATGLVSDRSQDGNREHHGHVSSPPEIGYYGDIRQNYGGTIELKLNGLPVYAAIAILDLLRERRS